MRVDLHCHLLPGVDDGPGSLEEALDLARALAGQGFNQAVATPHYIEDYSRDYREQVKDSFSRLKKALEEEGIPLALHLGGELMVLPALMGLARAGELPTLGGTRYVLLELPLHQPPPLYTEEVFFTLRALNYHPILAHPERVEAYRQDMGKLFDLVESGVLLQVNLGSLAGLYGTSVKKLARGIVRKGLASFLATDCHDASLMTLISGELKKPSLPEMLLGENPRRVLKDEGIEESSQSPPRSFMEKARGILRF